MERVAASCPRMRQRPSPMSEPASAQWISESPPSLSEMDERPVRRQFLRVACATVLVGHQKSAWLLLANDALPELEAR